MKILIATPLYPPEIGGPATYVKFLEEHLPKHNFILEVVKFGEVKRLPYGIRHVVFFFKVFNRGKDADIIYALDPLGVGVPAGLAAKFLRKRFFLRIAGDRAWETAVQKFGVTDSLDDFSQSNMYPSPVQSLKSGQTFAAKLAEKIIVPSEYLKKIVSHWGVKEEKIQVIYNAFNPVLLTEGKTDIRQSLSLSGTVLLSAGRLVSWKGFGMLIQMMPKILDKIPDAVLYIAGDGPDKDRLFDLSYNLRQEGRVVLLGAVPKEILLRYGKSADVFLLNTFYEGFSHQLLEIMSLGTPIVTTTSGGNPELVQDGVDGLLVQYNDMKAFPEAIFRILYEEGLRGKISTAAKEKAWKFSEERAVTAFVEATRNT